MSDPVPVSKLYGDEALRMINSAIEKETEMMPIIESISSNLLDGLKESAARDLIDLDNNIFGRLVFLAGFRFGLQIGAMTIISKRQKEILTQEVKRDQRSNGGKSSGEKRRLKAEKTWRQHATELAKMLRPAAINPTKLNEQIRALWKQKKEISESSIRRHIKSLIEKGEIRRW